jgi:hypothetical protein
MNLFLKADRTPFDFALELSFASGNGVNEGLQEPIL